MTVSLKESSRLWAKIGLLSFGGPASQIATMHRLVVEEKRWAEDAQFYPALNFCMLLPGPEALQLAIYLGWLINGTPGGVIAGLLFIGPGVITLLGLSTVYALYGHIPMVVGVFFGLKAGVIAILAGAVYNLAKKSLRTVPLVLIALVSFVALYLFNVPFPLIIVMAALIGVLSDKAPLVVDRALAARPMPGMGHLGRVITVWSGLWLLPFGVIFALSGEQTIFAPLALFFSKIAVVTFGGAYAILAYVGQEVVGHWHWLTQAEMVDGLGTAETTPGPLVLVLQFVGFMAAFGHPGTLPPVLAGVLGGLLTSWVTFIPCFLWVFLGAPYMERIRAIPALAAVLKAVQAAVVGVILNLGLWFALHTTFTQQSQFAGLGGLIHGEAPIISSVNVWSLALTVLAIVALFRFKLGMIPTLMATAGLGLVITLTL